MEEKRGRGKEEKRGVGVEREGSGFDGAKSDLCSLSHFSFKASPSERPKERKKQKHPSCLLLLLFSSLFDLLSPFDSRWLATAAISRRRRVGLRERGRYRERGRERERESRGRSSRHRVDREGFRPPRPLDLLTFFLSSNFLLFFLTGRRPRRRRRPDGTRRGHAPPPARLQGLAAYRLGEPFFNL